MKITSFTPVKLPLKSLDWDLFLPLLGPAHETVARFDTLLKKVNKKKLSSFIDREAGAQGKGRPSKEAFAAYEKALASAMRAVRKKPISLKLFCNLHAMTKCSSKKDAGRLRNRQNWIGPEKCKIEEAYFYPPKVALVPKSMNNLVRYIHMKEKDVLVQLAIAFSQLLIIHPFMNGNGRVARAMIPLFLYKKKITKKPLFFMSGYFKRHRLSYFQNLYAISADDNWEGWIVFFLKGVIDQGEKNIKFLTAAS